jgi:hypothetical protein
MKTTTKKTLRTLTTILGFATLTMGATLAAVAPRTTFADGNDNADRMGEYTADGMKFGDVVVSGQLVKDPHSRTGWSEVITAENKGEDQASCELETDLTRQMIQPMSRVGGGEATAVVKGTETITLAAHQKTTIRHDVPAFLAQQLDNADRIQRAKAKAQADAEKTGNYDQNVQAVMYAPYPSFGVSFLKARA